MRRFRLSACLLGLVVGVLTLSACIVEAPSKERTPKKGTSGARTVTQPTPLQVQSGAVLGDAVRLAAATFEPGRITPGVPLQVTFHFDVLDEMKEDYLIFVHVEDATGGGERFNADHQPQFGKLPTSQWKKGASVRDEFEILLPPTFRGRSVNVWMGLWEPMKDVRLPLRNPEAVKNDGRNRVFVTTLPVAWGQ